MSRLSIVPQPLSRPRGGHLRPVTKLRSLDRSPTVEKPCLLLVGDSWERLSALRAALAGDGVEIAAVDSLEELQHECRRGHALVAVDVAAERMAQVLGAIRASDLHQRTPVFVEASRLADDFTLAGVLPKFRAMPCSHAEMAALAQRRINRVTQNPKRKGVL